MSINDSHRRALSSLLRCLEERLLEFRRWIDTPEERGVFVSETNTLTADQREAIRAELDRIGEALLEARKAFDLRPVVRERARRLWSDSVALQLVVADLEPRNLRGYGELDNDASIALGELAKRLQSHLQRITDLAARCERSPCAAPRPTTQLRDPPGSEPALAPPGNSQREER